MIREFRPGDQNRARQLILAGLQEHFGELDPRFNEDLHDIGRSYLARGHVFRVAEVEGDLVGTGALLVGDTDGQIVRVSVSADQRRRGIAEKIVRALLAEAERRGLNSVWMETNEDWEDAVGFYLALGFRPFDHRDGCIYMRMPPGAQP